MPSMTDGAIPFDSCNVPCFKVDLVEQLRRELPEDEAIRRAADGLRLLGEPTRLKILLSLARVDELCVCDVANVLGMKVSNVSHQLRRLRDRGLVAFRNDGKMAYYRLADEEVLGALRLVGLLPERVAS